MSTTEQDLWQLVTQLSEEQKESVLGMMKTLFTGEEAKITALQKALLEGEDSGIAEGFDFEQRIAELKANRKK